MIKRWMFKVTGLTFMVLIGVIGFNAMHVGSNPPVRVSSPMEITIDAGEVAQRLAHAVRYRTISNEADPAFNEAAFRGLHEFVEDAFPQVHKALKREVVADFSLLYTWMGSDPSLKPILLSAHMDVVPVEPGTERSWTHPPFAGVVADGFVWGRGTLDMKASMMGVLEAVEYLLAHIVTPKRTIYLAFGHDEEIGGNGGAAKIANLLQSRNVKLDFSLDEGLVVTEGILPGIPKPVALIGIAEKGLVTLKLSARGPGGHGSMPPSNSAVGQLGRALARIEDDPMEADMRPPVIDMFNAVISEMPLSMRLVFGNRWLLKPLILNRLSKQPATNALVRSTLAVTIVKAGVKPNVIPQKAEALINVRLIPGDTVASVIRHLKYVIDDQDVEITIAPGTRLEASPISDTNSSGYQDLVSTAHQVFPDALVAPGLLVGTTDTRHYLEMAENSFRFLPLRIKPDDLRRFHGTNERIAITNYKEVIRFYIQLLGM
ncbi:MAG: M20 family peptidase [Gammaproteobacteria bacterium]|nr:M20 family peptidase [Gammaproteobacteria bacterium]MDX2458951.1 M20 family peptidase [Gammaproteobacteria bacterium]